MGVLSRLASTINEMTYRLDLLSTRGLEDWVEELAALHALQLQAQALLDIVLHLAAELGYAPESPREAAKALLGEGLLTREDYNFVGKVSGFRNVLVHAYAEVDMSVVRGILEAREYRRVALLASKLLEKASERGLDP